MESSLDWGQNISSTCDEGLKGKIRVFTYKGLFHFDFYDF